MRNCLLVIFIIYFLQVSNAQQNLEYTGSIEVNGYGVSEGLPFWLRTNTKGFLGNNHQLSAGASLLARDGFNETLNRNNLFLGYKNSFFEVVLGAKNRSVSKEGLSTINDDILYSGNARALPGVLLKTSKPIKIGSHIGIDLDLAHYVLNDSRATKNVNVHYKMLRINYKIKQKHTIAAALRHYVQWGGTLTSGRELPSNFDSYLRVFFGSNGGSESSFSDQVNAIGNHIGSYQVDYKYESEKTIINLYYQSIFEDRSGRELANFPDGVWGIYFKNQDKKLFQSFLYEFIHL